MLPFKMFSYISIYFVYVFLDAHKCQCISSYFKVQAWWLKDNFQDVKFPYHHMGPGTKTHDIRIMGQIYHS